jgi:hypothetical protein
MTSEGLLSLADLGTRFPPPPEDTPYYTELGRFIVAYAGAEIAIHGLARKLTRLKDDRARILFAGMRIGDVATRMRGLLRLSNYGPKTKRTIEDCLAQFDVIGTERDKMVHRTTYYLGGSLSVTNIMTSKSALAYERDQFTITDLSNLHMDCLRITLTLYHFTYPASATKTDRFILKFLRGPWRYRPAPRQNRQKPTRAQEIARLLSQPPSSQETP